MPKTPAYNFLADSSLILFERGLLVHILMLYKLITYITNFTFSSNLFGQKGSIRDRCFNKPIKCRLQLHFHLELSLFSGTQVVMRPCPSSQRILQFIKLDNRNDDGRFHPQLSLPKTIDQRHLRYKDISKVSKPSAPVQWAY